MAKQERITLPWMNKLRVLIESYRDDKRIIRELFEYGLEEEERLSKWENSGVTYTNGLGKSLAAMVFIRGLNQQKGKVYK